MRIPPFNDGLFSNANGIITSSAWRAWHSYVQNMLDSLSGGGGGVIAPSGTVTAETAYGQASNAGAAMTFSRGDHTHGTPAATSVAAVPLTVLGNVITFHYDIATLGVVGNDLYVLNDGHTHATQYLKLDGSNANVTIDINDEDFTTTGQLYINHDTIGVVTENIIEAEGELQSTTQDTTMNFFHADMRNGSSYPSAGTQIKCGFVVDNVCRHNQTGGTYRHYGAYFDMGSIAEIPAAPLAVNHDLYGARIGRGSLCVSNALGGSWQDVNAYGIYLAGWGGAADDDSGLANLNKWAIYSDGGDVELTNGNLVTTGDITCNTLNYATLNPAIVPAGANTQVQINNSGAFGADANFTYDFAGTATVGTGLNASTLSIATGSITDSTGTISFGDEDLITTGQINIRDAAIYLHSPVDGWLNLVADAGVEINSPTFNVSTLYAATDIDISTMTIAGGSITDTTGAISFGDEDISTTGTITGSNLSGTNTGDIAKTAVLGFPYNVLVTDNWLELAGAGQINLPDPAVYGNRILFIEGGTGHVTVNYGGGVIVEFNSPAFIWVSSNGAAWSGNGVRHAVAHSTTGIDYISPSDIGAVPNARTVNGKALSANITLGLASSDFANQGTTTTVLHGNAAGNPTFGAVVEADITLADNTTNDVSAAKHGFAPKAPNDATQGISGVDGTWDIVGYSPIGAIIAWHKTFTNTPALPSNWVECNGQTLSDGDSVYDGQVIPNLNGAAAGADLSNGDNLGKTGEVFLKGDETSGATQFDSFQGHFHDVKESEGSAHDLYATDGAGVSRTVAYISIAAGTVDSSDIQATTILTDGVNGTPRTASTTKPRNMTVVWIMRIK
jgi:hypothetical protein